VVVAKLARWGSAATLAAAFLAGAAQPSTAACTLVSAGPAYGQSWAERRQELLARGEASKPATTMLLYAPVAQRPNCGDAVAHKAPVRYRIALIAPTWQRYGHVISAAATRHGVPAELILATIVDESGGKANALATNPGYVSDAATPHKISIGLGQMLISSARRLAPERHIDRAALSDPATAIDLVARYHARFYKGTGFDPRLVASAYLFGSTPALRAGQRWTPRDPVHAARYTAVFEASVAHLAAQPSPPPVSFAALYGAR
jgi:soluble lytic murein transglycosylase-like protein